MKKVFVILLLGTAVVYAAAELTLKRPPNDGLLRLRWATDLNPARKVQTELFAGKYKGLKVELDQKDSTKLVVQCVTGTGPDIIDIYTRAEMVNLVESGVLLDLTPYAAEMGFGPEATYPAIKDVLTVGGRQYRFPCNVWANCVVYNKQIFDEHNVKYPQKDWTYDDFIGIGGQLRQSMRRKKTQQIVVANWNGDWIYMDMLVGHGGRFYSEDGLTCMLDSKESIATMQLYHDMIHKHGVIPSPAEAASMSSAGGWGSGAINWFSSGKAAMIFIGRWWTVQIRAKFDEIGKSVGAARLPRAADISKPGSYLASSGMADCRAAGVNKNNPNWQEGLKFLQFLASEDYGRLIVQDGDALPPNPALAGSGKDLVNATVPDAAFHQPFIDAVANARPLDVSPFIDAGIVARWLKENAVQVVENYPDRSPELVMRELAKEVNQQIRTNLQRRKDLQRKYEAITGRDYSPDWWKTYQKHDR